MDGILLIDKPSGPTSFDIVRAVRKRANQRRVGHAGTLDPLASGLLAVCLGQGTKLVPYLMEGDKRYIVRIALGRETDTLDSDGEVIGTADVPVFDEAALRSVLDGFLGVVSQIPPKYSAIKQNGEALYRKARRGENVKVDPREVAIHSIDIKALAPAEMLLDVCCAKGTYIRSLARDIAHTLDTVGHVTYLRRTESSGFSIEDTVSLDMVKDVEADLSGHLLPLAKALPHLLKLTLDNAGERAIRFGQPIDIPENANIAEDQTVALLSPRQTLVCIAARRGRSLQPLRVFPNFFIPG